MKYVSTRGQAPVLDFEEVLLAGLASDGGLYVPDVWPRLELSELRALRGLPYAEIAQRVMTPFVGDTLAPATLNKILHAAYAGFDHSCVAPLVQIGPDLWLMELFHGPTLAFKDIAMQVLGRLYDHVLAKRDTRITIVGATSGDTGSAAIEAIKGRERAAIIILYPHGRVSEVQRLQMTTVDAPNVHNIAIQGNFDDCQNLLKAMFNDTLFRDEIALSGVNSINWARIVPQVVYYVTAALALGGPDRPVSFSVPSGNFGDIFAGYVAHRMGLPIERLVVASNENDILARALCRGDHYLSEVTPTISPSMDIQISSNFERLLYEVHDRDGVRIDTLMRAVRERGGFEIEPSVLEGLHSLFAAHKCDQETTLATIAATYDRSGEIIDPHTAVGMYAAQLEARAGVPMVSLATAHPAKFPDAVEQAIGIRPQLPAALADLQQRTERFTVLRNDLDAVKAHIRAIAAAH